MAINTRLYPSERVYSFAGKLLQVLLEKKLNLRFSLDKTLILSKHRKLHENIRLIQRIKQTGSHLEEEFEIERLFQEAMAPITGTSVKKIRDDLFKKQEDVRRQRTTARGKVKILSKEFDDFILLYSKLSRFINDVCNLYDKRFGVLKHRIRNEEKLQSAKKELESLFCGAISEAIDFCNSKLTLL